MDTIERVETLAPIDGFTPGEKRETMAERAAGLESVFGPCRYTVTLSPGGTVTGWATMQAATNYAESTGQTYSVAEKGR